MILRDFFLLPCLILWASCAVDATAIDAPDVPTCGDGVCEELEHQTGCPQGCPFECEEDCHWCGDLKCALDEDGNDENEYTCPVDCAVWCAAGSILFACPSDTTGCCPNPTCGCCSSPEPDCSSDCCG